MSDENQPPKAPAPMKKTSAVSLKKETVRVTLKPDSAGAPHLLPAPPAPTIPLKTAGAPAAPSAPAPAPTIALKTAPAPTTPGGPSTVPLASPRRQELSGEPVEHSLFHRQQCNFRVPSNLGAPTAPQWLELER